MASEGYETDLTIGDAFRGLFEVLMRGSRGFVVEYVCLDVDGVAGGVGIDLPALILRRFEDGSGISEQVQSAQIQGHASQQV